MIRTVFCRKCGIEMIRMPMCLKFACALCAQVVTEQKVQADRFNPDHATTLVLQDYVETPPSPTEEEKLIEAATREVEELLDGEAHKWSALEGKK